jgi:hypothetical protein
LLNEIAATISRPLLPGLTTSIGIYSTGLNFDKPVLTDEPDAFYLTAGIRLELDKINLNLALADSHFSSVDRRRQTIIKVAAAVHL